MKVVLEEVRDMQSHGKCPQGSLKDSLERVEKGLILEALKSSRGNMAAAAISLGITERIMGLRVRKYGIDVHRYRE